MHDAHCHPFDLSRQYPGAEKDRREKNIPILASAWSKPEYEYHRELKENAQKDKCAPVLLSFGVHPQLFANVEKRDENAGKEAAQTSFTLLESYAQAGTIDAVGEIGFDLFDDRFRESEKEQEFMFIKELELAQTFGLPVVIHARKAAHKIFYHKKTLRKIKAVVFHSYAGTAREASALLDAGLNVFFSFGNALLNNHKKAQTAVMSLPASRILFETDAPYQPVRGVGGVSGNGVSTARSFSGYSSYADLRGIIEKAESIRETSGGAPSESLESITDKTFFTLFSPKGGNT